MDVHNFQTGWITIFLILLSCNIVEVAPFSDTILNAVNSIGKHFERVASTIESVVENVQVIERVLTDAIEEDCVYKCKNGAKPKRNYSYVPSPNGCGSLGLKLDGNTLPLEKLTKCCNKHDICYDTCNKAKDDCDKTFKTCLYDICRSYKDVINDVLYIKCKAAAKFMFTGTIALGCKSYKDAQFHACICNEKNDHDDL